MASFAVILFVLIEIFSLYLVGLMTSYKNGMQGSFFEFSDGQFTSEFWKTVEPHEIVRRNITRVRS